MTVNQEEQSKYVSFLQNQLSQAKDENIVLKRAIKQLITFGVNMNIPAEISLETPEEEDTSWVDKHKQFAGLRSQLLECTLRLIRLTNAPVAQDEALRSFNTNPRYRATAQNIRNPETLTRRYRELCQMDFLSKVHEHPPRYFFGTRLIKKEALEEPVESE